MGESSGHRPLGHGTHGTNVPPHRSSPDCSTRVHRSLSDVCTSPHHTLLAPRFELLAPPASLRRARIPLRLPNPTIT
jgi:hypothetical protein